MGVVTELESDGEGLGDLVHLFVDVEDDLIDEGVFGLGRVLGVSKEVETDAIVVGVVHKVDQIWKLFDLEEEIAGGGFCVVRDVEGNDLHDELHQIIDGLFLCLSLAKLVDDLVREIPDFDISTSRNDTEHA